MACLLKDPNGVTVCVSAEQAEKLKAVGYKPAAEHEKPAKPEKKKPVKKER